MHPLITKAFQSKGFNLSDLQSSGNIVIHTPTSKRYLTRIASGQALPQMKGEAAGLRAMGLTSKNLAPELIGFEVEGGEGGMVSEYWELGGKGGADYQRELAGKIAQMHNVPSSGIAENSGGEVSTEGWHHTGKYGFGVPTHCGISQLDNTWEESWEVFYRDRRLGDVIKKINDSDLDKEWEKMKNRAIPLLLRDFSPSPKPVICHGDLWSGNAGVDKASGNAVIWDPAAYWGHNESDLGVMHMFGGFTKDFFDEYHKIHPRSEPHYEERQVLYELLHHLNHTLMFGGSYKSGSMRMMKQLNSWAEGQDLVGE